MIKIFKTFLIGLVITSGVARAEKNFSVEIDPSTFAFEGYSGHVRYQLSHGWTVSVGTYKMTFPKLLNSAVFSPNEDHSTIKIDSAYGLFLDKYISGGQDGLFIGAQLANQNYILKNDNIIGSEKKYSSILFMPRVGYKYNLSSNFYLLPWMGIGYLNMSDKKPVIGGQNYELKNVIPFATLHVGYSF